MTSTRGSRSTHSSPTSSPSYFIPVHSAPRGTARLPFAGYDAGSVHSARIGSTLRVMPLFHSQRVKGIGCEVIYLRDRRLAEGLSHHRCFELGSQCDRVGRRSSSDEERVVA